VRREERGATLRVNGQTEIFDRVVVATHADTALKLLASPSELEAQTLGAWAYRACELFLHTDQELFPKVRGSWPSWNVECDSSAAESPFTVTYNLNRIQKIPAKKQYFVSWGNRAPCAEHVLERFRFRHPSFTLATEKAKESLPRLSSQSLAFCGSYFGNGFHEDAVASAITVSEFLC
jgi:predicted NAD/FAD-binding protein